ncbi:MAG TPA: sugar transferase [Gemmatimonadaceae bacterium]|nr:sugar transferase [Gemmatimonadaceae bacterium]
MTTTQRIEPGAADSLQTVESAPLGQRELSIHITPDVALHQAKAGTAGRHLTRQVARVLLIASGDAFAAAMAAIVVRALVFWLGARLGPVQLPYASATEFAVAIVVALLLTGNYQRSLPPHSTLHLMIGSALGAVVVCWAHLWSTPSLGAFPIAVLLTVVTTGFLFFVRGALEFGASRLLPDEPLLTPSIVVTSEGDVDPSLCARSGYRVASVVSVDGWNMEARTQELARTLRRSRAEAVIVMGDVTRAAFARILEISMRAGCEVLCTPPGYGVVGVRPSIVRRGAQPLIRVGAPSLQTTQFIAKRVVDVVLASGALFVAMPVGIVIAILIRLDSPGPVFFSQSRVGLGGQRFRMIKFRTMRVGADDEKAQFAHLNASGDRRNFKIVDDPRISRVGRFLRRWSLDELPQFLNVLAGQMSLVGPRPVPEDDFVDYEEHHFRRLGAKPGITGLWQVSGRSAVSDFEERVRLDTEYIDRWSLWLDLKILTMTLPAVMSRKGAY